MMAERLREAIETAHWQRRPVTVSLGVATLTPEAHCYTQLVQDADHALYAAKQAGRNRVEHREDHAADIATSLQHAVVDCTSAQRKETLPT